MAGYSVTGEDLQRAGLPYRRWGELATSAPEELRRFLDEHGGLAILYEEAPHNGHWVLLLRRGDDALEFLDSYGLAPDAELAYADYSGCQARGRQLLRTVLDHWRTVEYLGTPIQEWRDGINTCGRYVLLRWSDQRPTLAGWLQKYGFRTGPPAQLAANDRRVVALTDAWISRRT